MATQVIGSVAVNNLLPIQARGAGSVAFGPVAVPAGYSIIAVLFDLQQVTSLTAVLSATFEMSTDGVTWTGIGGAGLDLSRSGFQVLNNVLTRSNTDALGPGPVRVFGGQVRIPQTDSTTRQVRGTITASEALTSGVTLSAW